MHKKWLSGSPSPVTPGPAADLVRLYGMARAWSKPAHKRATDRHSQPARSAGAVQGNARQLAAQPRQFRGQMLDLRQQPHAAITHGLRQSGL